MWRKFNKNPAGRNVGDCTVRAISKALNQSWAETYLGLCAKGLEMSDMPSSNATWGAYLRENGFRRDVLPDHCPDCYTVADFAADHPHGTYILALSGHVVCVQDGDYYDSWESGNEIVIYMWYKEGL